ncbi:Uncharacterised protein [Mycobacteroides abscessus subsp. abscessus]|nr:Uncharacterised protein [Mycobacteroides abscessus subsp. abscessus]SII71724.1 Uncharacterised protein [Mycobacteroides abscessus subsp. abscessus]SIJ71202.1 Uncharacterised protein [Mycobacteroides abscessus subsp. abscessus]SIJ76359.1 Uncharacterised protein [Mycobacteroides abscessus subsp. abscessus]SIK94279.1 Uncharacterised protein [Mycobacteroides abscessus subsp. abscessus]
MRRLARNLLEEIHFPLPLTRSRLSSQAIALRGGRVLMRHRLRRVPPHRILREVMFRLISEGVKHAPVQKYPEPLLVRSTLRLRLGQTVCRLRVRRLVLRHRVLQRQGRRGRAPVPTQLALSRIRLLASRSRRHLRHPVVRQQLTPPRQQLTTLRKQPPQREVHRQPQQVRNRYPSAREATERYQSVPQRRKLRLGTNGRAPRTRMAIGPRRTEGLLRRGLIVAMSGNSYRPSLGTMARMLATRHLMVARRQGQRTPAPPPTRRCLAVSLLLMRRG